MKTGITILTFLFFFQLQSAAQTNWSLQTTPVTSDIKFIHAINSDTVIAVTYDTCKVLKTMNGGTNWAVLFSTNLYGGVKRMYWLNQNTGYLGMNSGGYYRTNNQGLNWVYVNSNPSYTTDIQFIDENTGYVSVDYTSQLFKTTNAGLNWSTTSSVPGHVRNYALCFVNSQTGWVSEQDYKVSKTTNGGMNWVAQPVPSPGATQIEQFKFFDQNTGYGIGYTRIYKTTNGGSNWTQVITSASHEKYSRMFFHNEASGWFTPYLSSHLKRTANGGSSWDSIPTGYSYVIYDITFSNLNTGWLACNNGKILKTTTGSGVLAPIAPTLVSPPNNSSGHGLTPLLDWDSLSTATSYSLQLSTDSTFGTTLINVQSVTAAQYQISSGVLANNVKYFWRVKASNIGGESPYSTVWSFRTALVGVYQTGNEIPESFSLFQNYPNPFNPVTKIKFNLPKGSNTKLAIIDILGKQVNILADQYLRAGSYNIEFNASDLSSGVYFYKLQAGSFTDVKKMVLTK